MQPKDTTEHTHATPGAERPAERPAERSRASWRADVAWSRAEPWLALALVALVNIVMARAYWVLQGYNVKRGYAAWAAFADIGTISGSHLGLDNLVMNNNPTGFDGQFYYYLALDPSQPFICARHAPRCALDIAFGEERAERILYPYTASALTLGHPHAVPYALLLVNFVAILVITWLVGQMASEVGVSRWFGAAVGLYCGLGLGFLRDLADPYAVMWVVVAIYLLRKQRPVLAALAVAAALLTREQLILTLPLLGAPLLVQRRWGLLAICSALALGPFIAWQVVLRALWGKWALIAGDTQGAGVAHGLSPVPFSGLWNNWGRPDFGLEVAFVAAPIVFAAYIALLALWRQRAAGWRGWRDALLDPLPLMTVFYSAQLALATSYLQWQDMWTPARLAALATTLGAIVVIQLPLPQLRASYATLLSITSLSALMLIIR